MNGSYFKYMWYNHQIQSFPFNNYFLQIEILCWCWIWNKWLQKSVWKRNDSSDILFLILQIKKKQELFHLNLIFSFLLISYLCVLWTTLLLQFHKSNDETHTNSGFNYRRSYNNFPKDSPAEKTETLELLTILLNYIFLLIFKL